MYSYPKNSEQKIIITWRFVASSVQKNFTKSKLLQIYIYSNSTYLKYVVVLPVRGSHAGLGYSYQSITI